jgi:hypothetical protein
MGDPVVANILAGGATVYYAPVGETVPDENSVGVGQDWGGNWERVGYTKAPLSALYEFEEADVEVEEELTTIKRLRSKENLTLETTLAEVTADYLALATHGTVTVTAPGASQVGKEELDVGGEHVLDEYAWGFEGVYVDGSGDEFPVRLFIWRATAKINGALSFSKRSGEYPGIPLQVKALVDAGKTTGGKLFKFQRVTAEATG